MSDQSDWEAIVDKVRADLAAGVNVQSMTVAGQTYSFRSLKEQRDFLEYAKTQAAAATGGGGHFSLGRFINA